jgi:hypothetical protein
MIHEATNKTLITDQLDTDELDRRSVFFIPTFDINYKEETTIVKQKCREIISYLNSKNIRYKIEHKPISPCGKLTVIQKI